MKVFVVLSAVMALATAKPQGYSYNQPSFGGSSLSGSSSNTFSHSGSSGGVLLGSSLGSLSSGGGSGFGTSGMTSKTPCSEQYYLLDLFFYVQAVDFLKAHHFLSGHLMVHHFRPDHLMVHHSLPDNSLQGHHSLLQLRHLLHHLLLRNHSMHRLQPFKSTFTYTCHR